MLLCGSVYVLGLFRRQCYLCFLLRVTELSALLTQSQKQNEDYEKMVKALRETMEILVCGPLCCRGAKKGLAGSLLFVDK